MWALIVRHIESEWQCGPGVYTFRVDKPVLEDAKCDWVVFAVLFTPMLHCQLLIKRLFQLKSECGGECMMAML